MGINKEQLRELIEETLHEIDAYSESAVNLLMGTAAQESHLGTYIKQIRGPALGIMQNETPTFYDVMDRIPEKDVGRLLNLTNREYFPGEVPTEIFRRQIQPKEQVYNLKLAIAMCRYKYKLIPEKLPDPHNIVGLAKYYKKYYNTHLGKATEAEFIRNYRKYVL
jgi:hypothetical protein